MVPAVAATTGVPTGAARSTPRCWPAAYGSSPFRNWVTTWPRTGQVQPPAAAACEVDIRRALRSAAVKAIGLMAATVGRGRRRRTRFLHPRAPRNADVAQHHSNAAFVALALAEINANHPFCGGEKASAASS